MFALRLLHLALAAGLRSNLDSLLVSDESAEPAWRTLGRLLVACRFVPLLVSCLGFQLAPGLSAALQAASVIFVLQHARDACASPFMQQPGLQDNLARSVQGPAGGEVGRHCLPAAVAHHTARHRTLHASPALLATFCFPPCLPCRMARFLGYACPSLTPTPMPAVDLPAGADPCMPLAVWVLVRLVQCSSH